MNKYQRMVLISAGIAIGLILLFPPYVLQGLGTGYHFILASNLEHGVVNSGQLFTQWTGVSLLAGIAWLLARSRD